MLDSENQAGCKWCPFGRVYEAQSGDRGASGAAATNRANGGTDVNPTDPRCIGSKCMAWRWGPTTADHRQVGFCGLAGSPFNPLLSLPGAKPVVPQPGNV